MDLLLHFKVNEGDENNINIQEYMLYGDVETKSEKCLVDEGDEVVLTEFPVPEFKNCTLMKKGDEGFYEYKDYRQGENAELAGGYAVSGILQQNKRFELQDELTSARNRQKEINKILDTSGNENSKVVVEDDLEEERNESCMEL